MDEPQFSIIVDQRGWPEFDTVWPVCECGNCERCQGWQLTPRTAYVLYDSLYRMAAYGRLDIKRNGAAPIPAEYDDWDGWQLFVDLPQTSWPVVDLGWRTQIVEACEGLMTDIAAGRWPEPRCTAEELLLEVAVQWSDETSYLPGDLPATVHPDDFSWDDVRECLYQDRDFMMLWDAKMDGIERPDDDTNMAEGIGDLRPAAWFTLFGNAEPR